MTKLKVYNILFLIFGTSSILMLFVIPFFIPDDISNDKTIATIYFVSFLTFTYLGNLLGQRTTQPTDKQKRSDTIDEMLN
jgi:hypothetical protein